MKCAKTFLFRHSFWRKPLGIGLGTSTVTMTSWTSGSMLIWSVFKIPVGWWKNIGSKTIQIYPILIVNYQDLVWDSRSKKQSFGLKKHFDSRNLLLDLPGQVHEAIRSQLQSSAESDCICRGLVKKFPTAVSAFFSEFPSCVCVKSGPGGCEHSGAESTMHRLPT